MFSSVLRGKTAVAVNIEIMRAFVELRRVANSYAAIQNRLEQIERGMGEHDEQLEQIFGRPPSPNRAAAAAKAAGRIQGPRGRRGAEAAMIEDEGEQPRRGEPSRKCSQPVPSSSRQPMGHDDDRERIGACPGRPVEPGGAWRRARRKAKVLAVHEQSTSGRVET